MALAVAVTLAVVVVVVVVIKADVWVQLNKYRRASLYAGRL